jgi:MSHA biogenesis protein MshQ
LGKSGRIVVTATLAASSLNGASAIAATAAIATSTSPVFQDVTLTNFSAGVAMYEAAKYAEVGLLNLEVRDSNYGDPNKVIAAATIDIGRFIPDHFKQTVVEDGDFFTTCPTGTTFAYSGQKDEATNTVGTISYLTNPILQITAFNKQGGITQNYYEDSQGSINDYMKLSAADITVMAPTLDQVALGVDTQQLSLTANMNTGILSQNNLTALPSSVVLPRGVLHYQLPDGDNFFYNRSANALVAPFTSDIDFSIASITDSDAVNISVDSGSTVDASPAGVEIRYGRLRLENSFGPEAFNFPQPMTTEHFDGNDFIITSNNNCLSYDASKISLTNISLDPALTEALGGIGLFVAGKTQSIELQAPGADNQGQIGVLYNTHDWLEYDWDSDGDYDDDPSATATFGVYRGSDEWFIGERLLINRSLFRGLTLNLKTLVLPSLYYLAHISWVEILILADFFARVCLCSSLNTLYVG